MTLISFVCGYADYLFFSWFFLYLVNVRGFSAAQGGLFTSAPFSRLGCRSTAGRLGIRPPQQAVRATIGRCGFASVASLVAAACIFGGASSESAGAAVFFLACGAALAFLCGVIIFTTVAGLMRSHISLATGFILLAGHLGGALSPL